MSTAAAMTLVTMPDWSALVLSRDSILRPTQRRKQNTIKATHVWVERKDVDMERSFHTRPIAREMSVAAVALSHSLDSHDETWFDQARDKTYEAETMFLNRSANVGNKMIVNIVYVPPAAAVRIRIQNTAANALFRVLKSCVSMINDIFLEHTDSDQKR
jgi:hypothetical protein